MDWNVILANENLFVLVTSLAFLPFSGIGILISCLLAIKKHEIDVIWAVIVVIAVLHALFFGLIRYKFSASLAKSTRMPWAFSLFSSMVTLPSGYLYMRKFVNISQGVKFYNADPYAPPPIFSGFNIFYFEPKAHVDSMNGGYYYDRTASQGASRSRSFYVSPLLGSFPRSQGITFWAASNSEYPSCESNCVGLKFLGDNNKYFAKAVLDSMFKHVFSPSDGYILFELCSDVAITQATYKRNAVLCFAANVFVVLLIIIVYLVIFQDNIQRKKEPLILTEKNESINVDRTESINPNSTVT